jgi:AAT family amino acid transporter
MGEDVPGRPPSLAPTLMPSSAGEFLMDRDSNGILYLESRRLVKRWNGPWPALVNTLIMAVFFYVTWWIFQDPRGIFRMYTPYVGYMVCRWMLILFIWLAYIFDFWPFKRTWLERTHPLIKGAVLTLVSVAAMVLLIKGFFIDFLGNYGIAYFNPERLEAMGITEFYALEYATEAIMMFAAIASWLSPSWVVACEGAPWNKLKQPAKGLTILLVTFFLSMIVYFVTMHSHMAILFYPWQQYTAITPPYWEGFANTVSGNFHIAWIMCCTVVVWQFETIWERYPFNLIKTDWLRRTAAFFGIILIALALCFFLYYAQDLVWGETVRGTRRLAAPDWRWLHVGEMAIFWLLPTLFLSFYCGNWPNNFSRPVRVCIRTFLTAALAVVVYVIYYKTSHLFLGTQKGFSHPQQFPMIPMIWLINIFLINMWFMDGWPGWKAVPKTQEELKEVEEEKVASDVRWSPALGKGLLVGTACGVGLYFIVIGILPWIGDTVQIIK